MPVKNYAAALCGAVMSIMTINSDAAAAQPAGVPANNELFYIEGSMGRLAARLSLPELQEGEKCPVVVLSHGFGGDMSFHLWKSMTEVLNANGIGTLRFDFNGNGQSEGEFENMTVPNENEDLLSVIAYLRSLPVTESISLAGHSQGGVVTSMVAGMCGKEQIACEVLLSAAAVLRDDALRGNTFGVTYDPWHLDKPYVELHGGLKLGRAYIQSAMNLPIYETAAKYDGPALIVSGMADRVVPYTYEQRYHEVLADSELILIPGDNHGLTLAPEYVTGLVADWLIARLRPKR